MRGAMAVVRLRRTEARSACRRSKDRSFCWIHTIEALAVLDTDRRVLLQQLWLMMPDHQRPETPD
jgi:hypothetical protein